MSKRITDVDLARFAAAAYPLYLSTFEASKASKFEVSDLAQKVLWLIDEVRRLRRSSQATNHSESALAYVDKSLDNCADLRSDVPWMNTEVVEVLEDVRSLLLTGAITPGTFTTDHEDGGRP